MWQFSLTLNIIWLQWAAPQMGPGTECHVRSLTYKYFDLIIRCDINTVCVVTCHAIESGLFLFKLRLESGGWVELDCITCLTLSEVCIHWTKHHELTLNIDTDTIIDTKQDYKKNHSAQILVLPDHLRAINQFSRIIAPRFLLSAKLAWNIVNCCVDLICKRDTFLIFPTSSKTFDLAIIW